MKDPPIRALYVAANNPAVTCPEVAQGAEGPVARGPVHRGARSLPDRHRELRRHRAAGGDLSRDRGSLPRLRRLLDAVGPAGRQAAGRGAVELRRGAGARQAHGAHRRGLQPRAAGCGQGAVQGRDRTRRRRRSGQAVRRRADPHRARLQRPAVQDAVGQARVLFRAARQAGRLARCPTGTRIRSKWPRPPSGRCAC